MIRRVIAYLSLPLLLMALVLSLVLSPDRGRDSRVVNTPSAPTVSLPVCITEDGAGMALCTWDAQAQGNGQGTSVISGDCAPSIMGEASEVCVTLHARASVTVPNEDGSSNTIPNGADLIAECMDEFDGVQLQECITEWL